MLVETGGLLLPKGKLQIEPGSTYVHTSSSRITVEGFSILPILVIGEINTERMKRDIFIEALTTRYGLLDNLQGEVKVPYRYQYERTSIETGPDETRDLGGIGDIEGGLSYQFMHEKGWIPDLIAGVSAKSRTGDSPYGRNIGLGTGHWGLKFNTVAVKSSDPAILFGSLGYIWNMERDNIPDYGKIDPGDTIEYGLGLAFALNYQTALNFQFQQDITNTTKMNDENVPASFTNTALLKCGVTYSINKNLSLDVMTSYGLTEDSPDFILEVRIPYTF